MPDPILRATDARGENYDDPSEDALHMFMEDLTSSAALIRVERLDAGREGQWAQVRINEAGLYEFDSSDHVYYVSSMNTIHDFLTRWAFDLPAP
jgi:hypothetical protein